MATQDPQENESSKRVAMKEHQYGPAANPDSSCGVCAYYNTSPQMQKCMDDDSGMWATVSFSSSCAVQKLVLLVRTRRTDYRDSIVDVVDFLTRYQKTLQTRVDDISLSVTSGSASDMEHYRAMIGEIQGITYALEELRALLKKVNYDDASSS